jgi:hypothetical protein
MEIKDQAHKVPLDTMALFDKEDASHPYLERLAYGDL